MSKKLLTVKVESLKLAYTGLLPGEHPSPNPGNPNKKNALTATLLYPRSGAPTVASLMQFDLTPNVAATPNLDDFFDSGLFKEEVLDETILELEIVERDTSTVFEKALLQVFATLFGAAIGVATGGLSKILGAITGLASSTITDSLKKSGDDQKQSIGKSGKIRLKVDELRDRPQRMGIPLIVPEDIVRKFFGPGGTEQTLTVQKNSTNGEIVLQVSAVPV